VAAVVPAAALPELRRVPVVAVAELQKGCGCGASATGPNPAALDTVNQMAGAAAPELDSTSAATRGLRNFWNAWTGNLLRNIRIPTCGPLNSAPVFTYNSHRPGATPNGNNFLHTYQRAVSVLSPTMVEVSDCRLSRNDYALGA
jgi:hypothetical protein